ncbi:BrnT family toxin [Duganella aceris]|uniref:BrnT family toxin n=1 Tax=Duganella aceris TaxID=2703883 RepID=A0ABX0FQ48_9BURK|nr:BrnT family toxin [Duganella aceris]
MLTWDENKRRKNLQDHGIDFADLEAIFDLPLHSEEDRTENHYELRLRSLGLLRGEIVLMIWAPASDGGRIISCRYGDKYETRKYFKSVLHSRTN